MRTTFKILFASLLVIGLNACGEKHKEGDGHDHGTEQAQKQPEKGEHEEGAQTIASLTPEQIKTVGITYGSVEMKELTATIKANGTLSVPNNSKANATSLYGGAIRTLTVQVGDYVRKGQVIATIANPQFIQLQEEYLTIGSKITFAEQELQRQKELNVGNAGAGKNLQSATADLAALKARKASLFQQIQLMGIAPGSINSSNLRSALNVTSPISGSVSNVFGKIGSYVDVSSPVVEIVDNGSLHLDLNVFEKDLPLMKVGQIIHFTLTNNAVNEYDAEVYSIGAAFENESKTIPVHARVKGNKTGLIDGMNITAIVSLSNVLAPAVASEAVVNADGKSYIFIVTDKKAEDHHEEAAKGEHKHSENEAPHADEGKGNINFEKIEVTTGVTEMGFTSITPVNEIPKDAKVVTKGAFFVNAKLSNTGEHEH